MYLLKLTQILVIESHFAISLKQPVRLNNPRLIIKSEPFYESLFKKQAFPLYPYFAPLFSGLSILPFLSLARYPCLLCLQYPCSLPHHRYLGSSLGPVSFICPSYKRSSAESFLDVQHTPVMISCICYHVSSIDFCHWALSLSHHS